MTYNNSFLGSVNLCESIKVVIGSFLKIGKLAQHHSAARVRVDFESQTSYMP